MKAADLNLKFIGCCLTMAIIARPVLAADALNGDCSPVMRAFAASSPPTSAR
jgi:hypothetical protein